MSDKVYVIERITGDKSTDGVVAVFRNRKMAEDYMDRIGDRGRRPDLVAKHRLEKHTIRKP
jgi:hypothetical protein